MADTLKADIAKELNITARRNDSFQLQLEVKDANGLLVMNGTRDSGKPEYQAKMTIINSSGEKVLNLYSYHWRDLAPSGTSTDHPEDQVPNSSTEGHYTGSNDSTMAIYLEGQQTANANDEKAYITVPHTYMKFQSGTYKYDFQIRKQVSGADEDEASAEYTTWLYGNFILNADITQV